MFITLLAATFLIAAVTSAVVALLFSRPINRILSHLVSDELAPAWRRYVLFTIYVVGISGGVRIWDVEKYITPDKEGQILCSTLIDGSLRSTRRSKALFRVLHGCCLFSFFSHF